MNLLKGKKAIIEVARKNGISVAEVRKEMEFAIDAAMKNPDPMTKRVWDECFPNGKKPTPEEFIVYIAKKVNAEVSPQRVAWLY